MFNHDFQWGFIVVTKRKSGRVAVATKVLASSGRTELFLPFLAIPSGHNDTRGRGVTVALLQNVVNLETNVTTRE